MLSNKIVRLSIVFATLIIALVAFLGPWKLKGGKEEPFIVRVRVAHDAEVMTLASNGGCQIGEIETGNILAKDITVPNGTEISIVSGGIKFGDKIFFTDAIRVTPLRGADIKLNGTLYRGEMDVIRTGRGFDAVNRVELEDYLKGVLPKEMHHFWPFGALKAQAIASRSFAVYRAEQRKGKYYDLTADTFSQVYGGQSSEKWRTNRAVHATRGKVLEYDGKILPAYFHSCCGGRTENMAQVWGEELEPLKGVKCSWCRWSPYFRWQVRVPTKTIVEKLEGKGYQIKRIDDIREGVRDSSGRLEYVRIRSRNKWFEISTGHFRSAISKRVLKSSNFNVKKYPTFYLFSGYGWGHGVGMCQWGAFGLAIRWKNAEWILNHYYPGAKIADLHELE
jgi:stage II sporulation protein D